MPMALLRSVVLPTPFRPIKQTTSPAPTVKSTPRTISGSPYATESCSTRNIGLPILSEIDFDHLVVLLHFPHRTFAKDSDFVKYGDGGGDLPDEGHVVFDDQQGVLSSHGHQQLAGFLGFAVGHAGHRLVDQKQLGVLKHDH